MLLSLDARATFEEKTTPRIKRKEQMQDTLTPKEVVGRKGERKPTGNPGKLPGIKGTMSLENLHGKSAAEALEVLTGE